MKPQKNKTHSTEATPPLSPVWGRVGKNLNRILESRKVNQSDLARRLDNTPSYVNRIVAGRKKVSVDKIEEIADALGADIIEFFYP